MLITVFKICHCPVSPSLCYDARQNTIIPTRYQSRDKFQVTWTLDYAVGVPNKLGHFSKYPFVFGHWGIIWHFCHEKTRGCVRSLKTLSRVDRMLLEVKTSKDVKIATSVLPFLYAWKIWSSTLLSGRYFFKKVVTLLQNIFDFFKHFFYLLILLTEISLIFFPPQLQLFYTRTRHQIKVIFWSVIWSERRRLSKLSSFE